MFSLSDTHMFLAQWGYAGIGVELKPLPTHLTHNRYAGIGVGLSLPRIQ